MATNPSLLIVPYRFKAAKLYSQLPESGAGDFTVTRSTTATRTNASGLLESVASGVPRLDYQGGGCPALLVEPAATNLLLRSEEFDNASWSSISAAITANNATAPNGAVSADLFVPASGSTGRVRQVTGISAANNVTYTGSIYFKKPALSISTITFYLSDTSSEIGSNRFGVTINLTTFSGTSFTFGNGVVSSVSVTAISNEWYRASFTGSVSSTATGNWAFACRVLTADGTIDGTNGLLIWGAQLETGSVATSYIPTVAATQTRNADVISVSSVSGLIGQAEGTLYMKINTSSLQSFTQRVITLSDGTTNNNVETQISANTRQLVFAVTTAGVSQAVISMLAPGFDLNTDVKFAAAYKNNDFVFYVNGTQIGVDTSGITPSGLSNIRFASPTGTFAYNGRILAAAIYTSRLSNAELAQLTTP